MLKLVARGGGVRLPRVAHNHEIPGSNPGPATTYRPHRITTHRATRLLRWGLLLFLFLLFLGAFAAGLLTVALLEVQ